MAAGFGQYKLNSAACGWLAFIAGAGFSTVGMQDMKGMEGDAAKGRWTLPLGAWRTDGRWSIAVSVMLLGSSLPDVLGCSVYVATPLHELLGVRVALRVLMLRAVSAYKIDWKSVVFMDVDPLPFTLFHDLSGFVSIMPSYLER